MATVLLRVDDPTEEQAAETVFVELDADTYEVDLTAANAARLQPYIDVARLTGQRPLPPRAVNTWNPYSTGTTSEPAAPMHGEAMTDHQRRPSVTDLDTSRPHSARMYDDYLGAPLARLEAKVALPALFACFPDFQLAADPTELRWQESFIAPNDARTLPVRLGKPTRTSDGSHV